MAFRWVIVDGLCAIANSLRIVSVLNQIDSSKQQIGVGIGRVILHRLGEVGAGQVDLSDIDIVAGSRGIRHNPGTIGDQCIEARLRISEAAHLLKNVGPFNTEQSAVGDFSGLECLRRSIEVRSARLEHGVGCLDGLVEIAGLPEQLKAVIAEGK